MGFIRKRGGDKLYKQWVRYSNLPLGSVPQEEGPGEVPAGREKGGRGSPAIYIGLGVGILLLCVGLVFLLVPSC